MIVASGGIVKDKVELLYTVQSLSTTSPLLNKIVSQWYGFWVVGLVLKGIYVYTPKIYGELFFVLFFPYSLGFFGLLLHKSNPGGQ